eukprot:477180_1
MYLYSIDSNVHDHDNRRVLNRDWYHYNPYVHWGVLSFASLYNCSVCHTCFNTALMRSLVRNCARFCSNATCNNGTIKSPLSDNGISIKTDSKSSKCLSINHVRIQWINIRIDIDG